METPEQILGEVFELKEKIHNIFDWMWAEQDYIRGVFGEDEFRLRLDEMENLLLEMDTLTEPYRVKAKSDLAQEMARDSVPDADDLSLLL